MMRSIESASSVFYHSQEEDPVKTSVDSQGSCRDSAPPNDSYQDAMMDGSPVTTEQDTMGKDKDIKCEVYNETQNFSWTLVAIRGTAALFQPSSSFIIISG